MRGDTENHMTEDHGMEYGKIFGSWQIRELIGKGSRERTRVYRITRNSHGILEEERALKTVTVCEAACLDKMTARARAEYDANRKVLCEKACNEVLLINRLEGEPHIVGYLDWELRDRTGGTDLLIAMHKVARNGLACYIELAGVVGRGSGGGGGADGQDEHKQQSANVADFFHK